MNSLPIRMLKFIGRQVKKIANFTIKNQYHALFKSTYDKKNQRWQAYVIALKIDLRNIYSLFIETRKPTLTAQEILTLKPRLQTTNFDQNKIKITFYASCRRNGNTACNLDIFLQTLLQQAENPQQIEVLIAIDPDDDIKYFLNIKEKFDSHLSVRIFISAVRHGYQKLHLYDKDLFQHAASSTKMFCDFSDDCRLVLPHFDRKLLEIDALHPDNIYFIHTKITTREVFLGDPAKNISLLFWIQQALEPASYFPIFSKKILELATAYAAEHDKNAEWSPLCNSWICDCYIDILSVYVKSHGLDRIYFLDMIKMNFGYLTAHQKSLDPNNLTPNNLAFIKMLQADTQAYLDNLAKVIALYPSQHENVRG